jgi:TPR repeat protein
MARGPLAGTGTVLMAVVCLAAAVTIQVARDRIYPRPVLDAEQLLYVRSPGVMARLVLGFDALAADVYWIRAIQHYGGDRISARPGTRRYELLYPLLDMTTSLDPHFNLAYRFGAIFLSEQYPGGAGRPDLAIRLLRKGIAQNAGRWQYHHDIGFIYYWSLQNRTEAATWFRRAAEQADAPDWLLPLAASMLVEANDRASSRYLWGQIAQSDQEWLRTRAGRALRQLDALDHIDVLTGQLGNAIRTLGRPHSWSRLAEAGVLRGVPADPTGTPFEMDPVTGEITVSQSSPLFPMPRTGSPR